MKKNVIRMNDVSELQVKINELKNIISDYQLMIQHYESKISELKTELAYYRNRDKMKVV